MTDTTNNQTATSKAPSHIVYHVRDRESGEGFWTRIGAAWAHNDGKGFNIQIETVPLDGRIALRCSDRKVEITRNRAGFTARPLFSEAEKDQQRRQTATFAAPLPTLAKSQTAAGEEARLLQFPPFPLRSIAAPPTSRPIRE